jgi:DNA polymerase V
MLAHLPPGVPLPQRQERAASGFPSPADDYVEAGIDLNLELIPSPLSTFFMRVSGDAMRGDGILDGDLVVIDRSIQARPGMVVVATCDGAFILRRLARRRQRRWLLSSDGSSPPIPLGDGEPGQAATTDGRAELWGVAIHAVHHLAGAPSRRR